MSKVDKLLYARNPGAAYHDRESRDSKKASTQFEVGSYQQGFFRGEASAHRHSAYESRRLGINPLLMVMSNPGGAASGKLMSMKLGLYPSDNVNMQHLVAKGKFNTLKSKAIGMAFYPVTSKSGHPWPGIYFMQEETGQVLVLETVPPSHSTVCHEESDYSPAEQALRRKTAGKNPARAGYEAQIFEVEGKGWAIEALWPAHMSSRLLGFAKTHESAKVHAERLGYAVTYVNRQKVNPGRKSKAWTDTWMEEFLNEVTEDIQGLPAKAWLKTAAASHLRKFAERHGRQMSQQAAEAFVAKWASAKFGSRWNPGAAEHDLQAWQCGASSRLAKTKKEEARWLARQEQELQNAERSKKLGLPNPGRQKRWVVTVPYPSGKKKTFLFSAPDKAAAKRKLQDMWYEGKFDLKGKGLYSQPIRSGWAVKQVGK